MSRLRVALEHRPKTWAWFWDLTGWQRRMDSRGLSSLWKHLDMGGGGGAGPVDSCVHVHTQTQAYIYTHKNKLENKLEKKL